MRTLFLHIPKNAGTSIKNSVPAISVSDRYILPKVLDRLKIDPVGLTNYPSAQSRFLQHCPYSFLAREHLSRFDRKFAVVRNPWDRVVSLYNYAQSDYIKKFNGTPYYESPLSWDDFLDRMDQFKMTQNFFWARPYNHWAAQSDWVIEKGKVKVDILRYEHIQADLNSYFDKKIDLPVMNKGKEVDYKEYYTEKQKQKVADWFRLDIEYWGFTFESGATLNYWSK